MNEDHLPELSDFEKEEIRKEAKELWPGTNNVQEQFGFIDGASLQLRRAKKREAGWVSVKERLPNENVLVLCCTQNGRMVTAKNDLNRFYHGNICFMGVTHWRPLPEPPKEP